MKMLLKLRFYPLRQSWPYNGWYAASVEDRDLNSQWGQRKAYKKDIEYWGHIPDRKGYY